MRLGAERLMMIRKSEIDGNPRFVVNDGSKAISLCDPCIQVDMDIQVRFLSFSIENV